jgi:hypothetical protein
LEKTNELGKELDTLEMRVELSFYRGLATPMRLTEEILSMAEDLIIHGQTAYRSLDIPEDPITGIILRCSRRLDNGFDIQVD